jgi:hypothetical protein
MAEQKSLFIGVMPALLVGSYLIELTPNSDLDSKLEAT